MSAYSSNPYVEPLGYQPVEFLDIPSMSEITDAAPAYMQIVGRDPSTRRHNQRSRPDVHALPSHQ